jgi:hypothetical protein
MTKLAKLALAAALTVGICGGGAMAQSVGPTDPAKADTTDPNSTPKVKSTVKVKKAAHVKKHHKTM